MLAVPPFPDRLRVEGPDDHVANLDRYAAKVAEQWRRARGGHDMITSRVESVTQASGILCVRWRERGAGCVEILADSASSW